MKNILIVAANLDLTYNFVMILRKLPYEVYLLMPDEPSTLYRNNIFIKGHFTYKKDEMGYDNDPRISTFNEKFIELIKSTVKETGADLILPVDNNVILTLAKYRDLLDGLPPISNYNNYETFIKLNDKWEFYKTCKECDLPVPESVTCKTPEEVKGLKISYPLIAKPLNHGNGFGISIIKDKADSVSQLFNHGSFSFKKMIVQKFIPGKDLQVLFVADKGKLITNSLCFQHVNGIRVFVKNDSLTKDLEKFIHYTKFNGPGLIDFIYDEQTSDYYFLEVNLRFPAGTYYHFQAGVNHIKALIDNTLGIPITGRTEVKKKKYILKPIWFYLLYRIERYFRA